MSQVFVNNGVSTLAANVAAADTTIFIQAGHVARFPTIAAPDYCYVTLENAAGALEIVKVTAHAAASPTLAVVRAQQGTTALDWLSGDLVELRLTKEELNRFERAVLRDGDTCSGVHDYTGATLKVKTPTTPSEAAPKSFVEAFLAAAAAAGALGQLPNQAGKAGKFLRTDGTLASFEAISNGGVNTQTLSANLVLNADSPKYQRLTISNPGIDLVLPDASTLTTGLNVFKVKLFGSRGAAICDNTTAPLGYLPAVNETTFDLIENQTPSGKWEPQSDKVQLDVADKHATVGVSGTVAVGVAYEKYRVAKLSDTLAVAAYMSSSANTTLVAVDLTTGDFGTASAASVDGSGTNTSFAMFPLNATQILLVFNNIKMVVATVSGLSISFGTVVALATSYGLLAPAASGGTPNIIKLSASLFLTVGGWSSNPMVTSISITGNVITQNVQAVTSIPEMWNGHISWVPLSATTALCSLVDATGFGYPFYNRTFVVTVSSGTPAFGTAISRQINNKEEHCPLLPYSSTKILQLLSDNTWVGARVLTVSGTTVTAAPEVAIRTNATNYATFRSYPTQKSVTHPNAYAYSSFESDAAYFPMGGNYYGAQSIAGTLDVLNVDFVNLGIAVSTQAIAQGGTRILSDTNHHLTFNYSDPTLTISRVQFTNAGASALSAQTITAKLSPGFNYTVGKNLIYANSYTVPSGSQIGYSILVTDTGTLKATTSYLSTQTPSALYGSPVYAFQFTLNSRSYATQVMTNNTVANLRLL